VRPPQLGVQYVGFADPSGGEGDSFAAAIVHAEGETIVLDCLYERRPPFNPSSAVTEVADLCRQYRVSTVVGDRCASGLSLMRWPMLA
jgi:hypothetical protein